jgi:hypothetical protein
MGKIKRDAINTKFRDEIDRMYREQSAAVGVSG